MLMTNTFLSPRRATGFSGLLLALWVAGASAGDLDAPAAPTSPGSAMFTLTDLYNRLNTGAAGAPRPGAFVEPTTGPGDTMRTLTEIMDKMPVVDASGATLADVLTGKTFWGLTSGAWGLQTGAAAGFGATTMGPFPAARTGQTISYATGDDGALQRGAVWPVSRFADNGNGTITDNLTGLVWLKNANCLDTVNGIVKSSGSLTWTNAQIWARGLANGACGLTDSSVFGQWRLPTIKELRSLINLGTDNPALPTGHPFAGVQSVVYWSSTMSAHNAVRDAWSVYLGNGVVGGYNKTANFYVWPVRGGL